jgi:ElaB/YqjD/DUF883 family membrane-anchored ribosome-binding protein
MDTTTDTLKRDWKRLRATVQARWPLLTDVDLVAIDGDRDYLVQALVHRYGFDAARAEREWRAFAAHLDDAGPDAASRASLRNALGPAIAKLRESLAELGAALRAIVGDTVEHGRGRAHDAVDQARDTTRDAAAAVVERTEAWLDRGERFVRERPLTAVALAFAAGWLLFHRRD